MILAWRLCRHAASDNLVYPLNLSLPGKQSINALLNQSLLAQDVRGVCLEELGDAIKDCGAGLKKARAYLAVLWQTLVSKTPGSSTTFTAEKATNQ